MIEEHQYGPAGEHLPESDPTEILRTAMNAIHQQPDTGMLPAELCAVHTIAEEVAAFTVGVSDYRAKQWHRAAMATKRLLSDHSEEVKAEWLAAYASLPPMEMP